jgi:hypothetical protein
MPALFQPSYFLDPFDSPVNLNAHLGVAPDNVRVCRKFPVRGRFTKSAAYWKLSTQKKTVEEIHNTV